MHLGQPLRADPQQGVFLVEAAPIGTGGVSWVCTDTLCNGTVEFDTTVRVNGQISTEAQNTVLCRLFSHFVLSRLDQTSLNEACEILGEIYSSQQERAKISPDPAPQYIGTFDPNVVERQPLLYHHR
jgi:hypothetical protein